MLWTTLSLIVTVNLENVFKKKVIQYRKCSEFYFRGLSKLAILQRGAGGVHGGTPSQITLYILRNH